MTSVATRVPEFSRNKKLQSFKYCLVGCGDANADVVILPPLYGLTVKCVVLILQAPAF